MKQDISGLEDIKKLVDTFYRKVQKDSLLGTIFNEVIQDNWPQHLEKMYSFWQTVLLGEHTYYGSPFPPHAKLPVTKVHFERWLALFSETLTENFEGEKATEALWRAEKMAEMFQYKIKAFRETKRQPLI
jgi:hemoglobin